MGERVGVVDNHPTVNASMCGHLADEEGDGAADGLDAAILFRAELEGFEGLMRRSMRLITVEKRPQKHRLSRTRWTRQKEVRGASQVGKACGPYCILTNQGRRGCGGCGGGGGGIHPKS